MKRLLLFLVLSTTVAISQPGWADNDEDAPGRGRMACMELNLTAEQQKQFDDFRTEMMKKQIDMRAKIQTLRLELADLYREDTPAKSKMESKISDIGKTRTEMKMNHLDFWFKVNKILTPEQQKIWKEHRMMTGAGRGDRQGRGMMNKGSGRRGMMGGGRECYRR